MIGRVLNNRVVFVSVLWDPPPHQFFSCSLQFSSTPYLNRWLVLQMYWNNNDYTRDIANDFQPGFPLNISATTPTTYDIATSGQCYITGAKPCFPEYPNLVEAPTPWTVYMYVSAPYTFGGSNVVIDDDNLFVQFRFSITKTPLNATVVDDWTIEVSGENLGEGVEPGEQGGAIWTVQSANLTESNVPFQRPVEDASQTWNTSLARVQIDPSHCDNMFNTVTLSIQASLDTVEISCFDLVAVQTGTGSSGGESEDDPEPTTGDDVEEDGEDEDEDGGDSSGEGLTPTVQLSVGIGAVALLVVLLALRPSSGTEKPEKQRLTLAKAEQAEGLKSKNKALSRTKGPSKGNSSKQPKSGKSKTLTPNPANESERSSVSQVSVGSRSSTGAISTASSVLTRREMKRR